MANIPKNVRYNETSDMLVESYSENNQVVVNPIAGSTYLEQSIVEFNIGMNKQEFHDTQSTCLSFDFSMTVNAPLSTDHVVMTDFGANMFLNELVLSNESNELERIQHYQYRYKAISLIHDLSSITAEKRKLLECADIEIVSGKKYRVFLNLLSFYGSLSDKYFPSDLVSGFLRLQITFGKLSEAVHLYGNATATDLVISNPKIYLQTTKVNNMIVNNQTVDILGAVRRLPVKIYSSAYDIQVRSYRSSDTSSQTETFEFSAAKYTSLRDVIFFFVPQTSIGVAKKYQQDFCTAGLLNYQILVNNDLYPKNRIIIDDQHSEAFVNIQRCSGIQSDIFNSTSIKRHNFIKANLPAAVVTDALSAGECLYGMSLEPFTSTSKMDNVIMSGVDTRNKGIGLRLEFGPETNETLYRMYVCFHYNMSIEVNEMGICSRYI
jgi:hypothetical protein